MGLHLACAFVQNVNYKGAEHQSAKGSRPGVNTRKVLVTRCDAAIELSGEYHIAALDGSETLCVIE